MATDGLKSARKQPKQTMAKTKRRRHAKYPAKHKAAAVTVKTVTTGMALISGLFTIDLYLNYHQNNFKN
jgi:hypothetical protein